MAAHGDEVQPRTESVNGVCFLFRHGARSLSGNAKRGLSRALDELMPSTRELITTQWDDAELGQLSAIGAQQMEQLAGWAWNRLLDARARGFRGSLGTKASITWGSSPMERVLQSGKCLLEVITKEVDTSSSSSAAAPSSDAPSRVGSGTESSSDLFIPWAIDEEYKEWVAGVNRSKAVLDEAKARSKEIESLAEALARMAGQPCPALSEQDKMRLLYNSTYLEEVIHCERYDAGTLARAASGEGIPDAGASAGSAASQDEPRVLAPDRSLLIRCLTLKHVESVRSMARWVWKVRFFLKRARRLGLRMLRAILLRILPVDVLKEAGVPDELIPPVLPAGKMGASAKPDNPSRPALAMPGGDCAAASSPGKTSSETGSVEDKAAAPQSAASSGAGASPGASSPSPPPSLLFSKADAYTEVARQRQSRAPRTSDGDLLLLSGHDYSIVCLLSALRLADYPERTIGFGAYVVMESRRSPGGEVTVSCLLNCEPFPGAARGDGTAVSSEHLQVIFDDLPAESLLAMCMDESRLPPTAADVKQRAAAASTADPKEAASSAGPKRDSMLLAALGASRGPGAGADGGSRKMDDGAVTPAGDWAAAVDGEG